MVFPRKTDRTLLLFRVLRGGAAGTGRCWAARGLPEVLSWNRGGGGIRTRLLLPRPSDLRAGRVRSVFLGMVCDVLSLEAWITDMYYGKSLKREERRGEEGWQQSPAEAFGPRRERGWLRSG